MSTSPSPLQDSPNPDPITSPDAAVVKPDADGGKSPTAVATPNGSNDASPNANGAADGTASELGKTTTTTAAAAEAAVAPSAADESASTPLREADDAVGSKEDTEPKPAAPSNAIDIGDDAPAKEGESTPAIGSPAVVSATLARVPTPSSRTSTPPLTTAATKKKFSSVNVNKEFLSKAASPVPAPAKLVRPVTTAAPIQSTSSKLLSTKLTTVPSSKPSASPKPAGAASTAGPSVASPWAKPVLPAGELAGTPLQHPAPTRGHNLPNVAMGSGHGLGSSARRAWGHVGADGRRGGPPPLSREFPTAKEVAEGKRVAMLNAQAVAQAEAAHNQAILAGLNEFTHLEPNAHRWDEEDEDDDVMDFGDGQTYSTREERRSPDTKQDQPVTKSERFAEDFDRSWPRSAPAETRPPRQEYPRTLFNASSNRLESHPRQASGPQSQPPKLMSRDAPPHAAPPHAGGDRPLPPHLADSGRMLPPHMAGSAGPTSQPANPPSSAPQQSARPSWRSQPERPPPHFAGHRDQPKTEHHEPPPHHAQPATGLHRTTSGQPQQPPHVSPVAPAKALPSAEPPSEPVVAEEQAAEMHSAAEKARLRRMQEEADREAAAERARQKARELAERFGDKSSSVTSPSAAAGTLPKPPPPPGLGKPQVTIASRPRPEQAGPEHRPSVGAAQPQAAAETVSTAPADRASSWRRSAPLPEQPQPKPRRPSSNAEHPVEGVPRDTRRPQREAPPHAVRDGRLHPPPGLPALPSAPRDAPPHVVSEQAEASSRFKGAVNEFPTEAYTAADKLLPKKEPNFDNMLARLQAAMAKARRTPPLPEGSGADSAGDDGTLPQTPQSAPVAEAAPAVNVAPTPAPHLPFLPPDFFDATQIEPPRSPPPAWRQYTVKFPKDSPTLASIPRWRQRAAESHRHTAPKGWAMSFEPPIEGLHSGTIVADLLLPQPIGRRFAKHVDTGPIVSISPRSLLTFERKNRRRPTLESRNDGAPALKGAPHAAPSLAEPSRTEPPLLSAPEPLLAKPIPSKDGRRFLAGDDGTVGTRLVAPQASADKPFVRFMVSSELDGDSLLNEVNQVTLEGMGETDDKRHTQPAEKLEKPRTPPPTAPSAARTNPTSPGAASAPWGAKSALGYPSPARDISQHDHIKSVWETSDAATGTSAPASAPSQPETPLYPSLSTPSVSNDGSAQAVKTGYGQSSAFGVRSNQGGGYGQFINSGTASPDAGLAGGMSLQYGIMGRGGAAGAGANGFQQGVWSSPFGTSMAQSTYGYSAGKAALEQKGFAAKDGAVPYGSEYRYPVSQAAGAYSSATGTGGTYNGYPAAAYGARNPQSVYGQVGGYAHNGFASQTGFGTQMANPRSGAGRGASTFQNVNGVDYQAMSYDPSASASGYYPAGAQPNYSPGYTAGGVQRPQGARGAVGRKMW